jgi:hypothetical protein
MNKEIKDKLYEVDDLQKFIQSEIYIQQFDQRRVDIANVTKHYKLFSPILHITNTTNNGN